MDVTAGNLVSARGREWIVLSGSTNQKWHLQPLAGNEEESIWLYPELERDPLEKACFSKPGLNRLGTSKEARLLRFALKFSLRRGAGPFRSFGQIAVEPKLYQLVPLKMALQQETVRLLLADDVGLGKTIEAGLILRELWDRGEIDRFAVLCPPHLVSQWVEELEQKFHFSPTAITAQSAQRLDQHLLTSESIFSTHPQTVISLDYVKSDRRRHEFLLHCPNTVVVDEVHLCVKHQTGENQRYDLLNALSQEPGRNLILMTATPHSGDEEAFFNLIGLLKADLASGIKTKGAAREQFLEKKLSPYFVQRNRKDVENLGETRLFPRRENADVTYRLSERALSFLNRLRSYSKNQLAARRGNQAEYERCQLAILALLRCLSSSPQAGLAALQKTAGLSATQVDLAGPDEDLGQQLLDQLPQNERPDDEEPNLQETETLRDLVEEWAGLMQSEDDNKFNLLCRQLRTLLKADFRPVIFCRFIATAEAVAEALKSAFSEAAIECVTGHLSLEERKLAVQALDDAYNESKKPILVATDCLSEGINLQQTFNAVIHYDLSWNPNRFEQREGRVDRFGQKSEIVKSLRIYGQNNPIDQMVRDVIGRKEQTILRALKTPEKSSYLTIANVVIKSWIEQGRFELKESGQGELFSEEELQPTWAQRDQRRTRTRFSHSNVKPGDIWPEWEKTTALLGSQAETEQFWIAAFGQMNAKPRALGDHRYAIPTQPLPLELRGRMADEGLSGSELRVDFQFPAREKFTAIQRCHPLVGHLADLLLKTALSTDGEEADPWALPRAAAWITAQIEEVVTVALLRIRHQLKVTGQEPILVEEACTVAFRADGPLFSGKDAEALLDLPASGNLDESVIREELSEALKAYEARLPEIEAFAEKRAEELLADHQKIRADARGEVIKRRRYSVTAMLPADLIGLYVLLPE